MTDWHRILDIATELGVTRIREEALAVVNRTAPAGDRECAHLAEALQEEIRRKLIALAMPREGEHEIVAARPNEPLQRDMGVSWNGQRSDESAVEAALQRLDRMLIDLLQITRPDVCRQ